jgi:hypothetical protein
MLAFTRSLGWLISAFHNRELARLRSESGYSRGTTGIVNDTRQEQREVQPILYNDAVIPDRARG